MKPLILRRKYSGTWSKCHERDQINFVVIKRVVVSNCVVKVKEKYFYTKYSPAGISLKFLRYDLF
jgi:hypothetical protein